MISATLITLNEQRKVAQALKSIQGLADEIIVVDCGSSDKTCKIAEEFGAKVYFRKFDNFANQKNFALAKAEGNWIIALDADEEIPPELATEIRQAVNDNQYAGYLIPRRNSILGAEIKHSRWSPDSHIWLWKKGCGKWIGEVHEEVVIQGKVGRLRSSKIHNSHETISSFMGANNLYSSLEAQALVKKGINFSFWRMFQDLLVEFLLRFFYKLGFLDGKRGFSLSFIMGIYKLTVWIKLWELQQNRR